MRAYRILASGIVVGLVVSMAAPASGEATLDGVKKRGYVQCGVSTGYPGFSIKDEQGKWTGLDVDMCRAVAAAVFGDASKVNYRPLAPEDRFAALQSGKVDLLAANATWTFSRDSSMGLDFVGVLYYDGQQFMVPKRLKKEHAWLLNDVSVCVGRGTTTENNLADYFKSADKRYTPVLFESTAEAAKAFTAGRCDVFTSDRSLFSSLKDVLPGPSEAMILPEAISREPLGPVVREGDSTWCDIVRWTLFAMINGEELGVSSKNVTEMRAKSAKPEVRRLTGMEGDMGKGLGLSDDWAFQIIRQVGNYEEIFERNLGRPLSLEELRAINLELGKKRKEGQGLQTGMNLSRGLNALWRDGGLMYAPPLR